MRFFIGEYLNGTFFLLCPRIPPIRTSTFNETRTHMGLIFAWDTFNQAGQHPAMESDRATNFQRNGAAYGDKRRLRSGRGKG